MAFFQWFKLWNLQLAGRERDIHGDTEGRE